MATKKEEWEWVSDEYLQNSETGEIVSYRQYHELRDSEEFRIKKEIEKIQYYLEGFLYD